MGEFSESSVEKFLVEKKYINSIFSAVADVLLRLNKEGLLLDIVSKDEEKFVFMRKELIGKRIEDVLSSETTKKIMEAVMSVLESKETTTVEYEQGSLWLETHISCLSDEEVVVIIKDITQKKTANQKIYYLSYHDKLTDLYNRAYFEEVVEEIDRQGNLPISVIMADVNGLKLINDTYGHFVGDKMLKICSDVLLESCREGDIVSRWGGDEFMIILPKTTEEEARKVSQRIFSTDAYVENIPISMTIGLSAKNSVQEKLIDVIKRAEDVMYSKKLNESKSAKNSVIEGILLLLGEKSYESREHTYRMQKLAKKVGERINLPSTEVERLGSAILLHDVGKINIPKSVLLKEGPLSEDEKRIIEKHPEFGYRIARSTDNFSYVAEDILSHHERWDGKGYPRGLKKEEITLLARITSVVDAYDAMKIGRSYRMAKSNSEIIAELEDLAGKQFDPNLVDLFISILKEKKFFIEKR